jgi:hypothetical protein
MGLKENMKLWVVSNICDCEGKQSKAKAMFLEEEDAIKYSKSFLGKDEYWHNDGNITEIDINNLKRYFGIINKESDLKQDI